MGNQMLVLFLAFLLWFCHGAPTAATPACKAKERRALMELKAGLRDPSGRLSSWIGEDCCTWSGVACNNQTGHAIRLNLRNSDESDLTQALGGKINPSLAGLEHLRCLDLSGNAFWGVRVPPFIGTFKELRYLNLSFSRFSGPVPHQLGNLSSLRSLDLSNNGYYPQELVVDGSHWLSQLSSLRYLDMSFVNLRKASNCLQALSTLPIIHQIRLSSCQIGSVPLCLPHVNFTSLSLLDISGNFISTKMPNWLFNLTDLEFLYLSDNQFQGLLPDAIGNMTSLKELDLSNYGLQIRIPETLQKLCRLRALDLYGRNISNSLDGLGRILSGCIRNSLSKLDLIGTLIGGSQPNLPSRLFNLTSLQYLGISMNGSISAALGNMTLLETLDMSGSNLEGLLPLTLGKLCRLRSLYLNSCNITGALDDFEGIFSGCIGNSLTELGLFGNSLNGVLPEWLFNLKSLQYLSLSQNAIHGTIPENLGKLSELKFLNLANNMLYGTIPENLGKLSELKFLNLANNMLYGTIPENLGKLSELEGLYLRNNSLEGILSEAHFVDLTKLKWMGLSFNNLTIDVSSDWQPPFQLTHIRLQSCQVGPDFPAWILTQEALYWVDLSHSKISGSVPDRFWNLTSNMAFLDLSNNNLSGMLPDSLRFSDHMVEIYLGSNLFEGPLPRLPLNLELLNLSHNSFSGPIPLHELEELSNLYLVDLSSNFFSGHLPHLPMNVRVVDLSNNSFSGTSPQDFVKTQCPLNYLSLSMNNISGTIPSSLCELEDLEVLVLSDNQISGEIPHCLLQASILTILDISSNKISGMIPNSTSYSLERLHLNNNSLLGELPYFLKRCRYMVILDLSHNKFSGNIPSWIGEGLRRLRILNLRSNLFSGNLPLTLHHLAALQILDLSHNCLSGTIPQGFGNFIAMKYVNMNPLNWLTGYESYYTGSIILEVKGTDMHLVDKQLYLFVAIDLSNNGLFGTIPEELANLYGLQILNVSGNNLSGRIMAKIGELRQLESLDLSSNQLSGGIPPSMCDLSFLGSLNLSHNNLSGRIPRGGQLNALVDPSIYAGNHDLCGFPLTNDCMGDGNTTIILDYTRTEEDEMLWFYLGIMAGFGLGFWGVWGILLVKRSWRYSYFRSIDNLYAAIRINFGKWKCNM